MTQLCEYNDCGWCYYRGTGANNKPQGLATMCLGQSICDVATWEIEVGSKTDNKVAGGGSATTISSKTKPEVCDMQGVF